MKVLLTLVMGAFLTVSSASAETIKEENPYTLVKKVADKTFERIGEERSKITENPNYLKTIVKDELMPYVDNIYASKKVLGRYFKDTDEKQRQEFYKAFTDYIVATYARAFTQYDESKHEVEFLQHPKVGPDDKVVVVETRVKEAGRPPIRLDFKVRYDNNADVWKAYDLVVEGVSLLNSKQSEIAAVIRSRGIEGTIALLEDKAGQPIKLDDKVDVPS
ncbi:MULTISPECIES: ABC transporter substrate-binding protein [Idiomarina]|jgi:phospholipid transport system substrate-binding protein|uniref:Organic solvent ABC transporter n=2 Tax=Idiomarina baltica TaxID=190892 RepID=A0A348WNH9_9GAMM|nr:MULTISPECIES: ABC transporter substrate-binding protein [Idiomarina]MEC8925352.1 ABC transporter substrate-binding protein [Pseudomonadota bacterium]EAQ31090.1 ABC-type transport system involved in resistance to organic solvents, auxiliary component [Idiomarina baltica OS145]KXS36560.1 MAG: ABC-type transport system involved in resistance to organic solvent auxiliary component [Idiomarina sp. T82-3]HAE89939.1 organic solvent ABC transporter [Idiomarina sp.]HAR56091.1 organic solvent ABC tra|tara:strand:- start:3012 stop:3668 length:657 start_codon:yes stop_codon:yes gene_type:complete